MSIPEARAMELLRSIDAGSVSSMDTSQLINKRETLKYIRQWLPQFPSVVLAGRTLTRKDYRFRDILRRVVRKMIQQNRRRCELWARYVKCAVLKHLECKFNSCTERIPAVSSMCKAEADIYVSFPTIAKWRDN